ncbi:MAG: class I SAM-dependent methyltransferase, partial [bacterium]
MKLSEKKRLMELYESRYQQYGYNVKTIGWGNIESQRLRFKVLTKIADLNDCRICDLGCGFGDLYPYLKEHFENIHYLGIDLSEKLIKEAKQRHPEADFRIANILETPEPEKVDYVLSSGALSFKLENQTEHVEKMLKAMMDMSTKGVAVNFLSSYVDYQLEKNFHFSPEAAFSLGRKLTRFVTIRHDYPL